MSEPKAQKGKTRLTPAQQAEHDAKLLKDFNERFPVGAVVWYWASLKPGSPVKETRIQQRFFLLPTHYPDGTNESHPVTFVEGRRGYVSGWHLTEPNEEQRPHLDLEVIHSGEGGRL